MKENNKASKKPKVAALIVAGGRGTRLGDSMPKQYLPIAGEAMVRRAAAAFAAHAAVDAVQVVIHPEDAGHYKEAMAGLELLEPVHGGEQRQDSVRMGLESLQELAPNIVLIHDAARPFVSGEVISQVLEGLAEAQAVIPAVPVADTLKSVAGGVVQETVSRENLVQVQTPQGFDYAAILVAHQQFAGEAITDDAGIAEKAGIKVVTVAGSAANFKVTTEEDLMRAEQMVGQAAEIRVGQGVDVHGFSEAVAEDNTIMLCGVAVPFEKVLVGHSDGDVGLHAVVDALLGAIGAGDIGQHFDPGDAQWRDADSAQFMVHAKGLVAQAGGVIQHLDVTLVAEAPKVGPYREAMQKRVAELLDIVADRVSIKATTTDKLGFLGRGEGIAAQALATVKLIRRK